MFTIKLYFCTLLEFGRIGRILVTQKRNITKLYYEWGDNIGTVAYNLNIGSRKVKEKNSI